LDKSSEFRVGLTRLLGPDGRPHGFMEDRRTNSPSVCGSVYEASLSGHVVSHNSLYTSLGHLASLLSFALDAGIDLERRLLAGRPLTAGEIDRFANWLIDRVEGGHMSLSPSKVKTINARLRGARLTTEWFITQYLDVEGSNVARAIAVEQTIKNSRRAWRRNFKRQVKVEAAPDIPEDELSAIETFLRDASSGTNPKPMWVRAYLIWRLAIEFGFRIGEILALRLEDCPSRTSTVFRIVRIEERIGYSDPRGVYAPRPKTLSRDLAPVLRNSVFPRLVVDYQSDHRMMHIRTSSGRRVKRPVSKHPYLIVNDKGDPLPIRTAGNLAQSISREVGVPFHWHLARHAFFNRAYYAVAQVADFGTRQVHLKDLIHWGGGSNEDSIGIYSQRARAERALTGLAIWNGAANSWRALS